ncbi:MAG: hypothetical protein ACP5SH_11540 [Syntrophobacteraceae bacterium]
MKLAISACLILLLALGMYFGLRSSHSGWSGVDDTVVEKLAVAANHPPTKSLIDIEHGDLPLLMFLLAGVAGGFVAGYQFRGLFPPKDRG